MNALVADTHAAVWYYAGDPELSPTALAAMDGVIASGRKVALASISLVEVAYLERRGRVPKGTYADLCTAVDDPELGLILAPLDRAVCDALLNVPREEVPDMPDRIIAATALSLDLPPCLARSEDSGLGDPHGLVISGLGRQMETCDARLEVCHGESRCGPRELRQSQRASLRYRVS